MNTNASSDVGIGMEYVLKPLITNTIEPDAVIRTLSTLNDFLNRFIGLAILVCVCALLVYVIAWIFAAEHSEFNQKMIRGAIRSYIGLFLMVNVWTILHLLQIVVKMSPLTAFLVFFTLIIVMAFWSLFNLGNAISEAFSEGVRRLYIFVLHDYKSRKTRRDRQFAIASYAFIGFSVFVIGVVYSLMPFS
jgi:hypothetical protein